MNATSTVTDLVFGRWKSQILYTGVALGVFDHVVTAEGRSAEQIACALKVDPGMLFRLLRALASLGLLAEHDRRFAVSESGLLLQSATPGSLRDMVLLEEGPEHYSIWAHLANLIRDGQQNAFVREFGQMAFEYAHSNSNYGATFRRAMSSFSSVQSKLALEALRAFDFGRIRTACDVAGGQGHLMCSLLVEHERLEGIVFDLPEVIADKTELWAAKMGLEERCYYVAGDMFEDVPAADLYLLKMILHDWNDEECVRILSNIRRRVSSGGKLLVVEHIVPADGEPHFSKLYDIHMMCWGSGKERTEEEYSTLLSRAGWTLTEVLYPAGRAMGVIEGTAA
ncbi:hydroxyneurosporene methyltransferase [Agrobacterium vitis]|uniref:acetylserotonin O-methyltransferase n=1 Tax=Allorhizobium ampelinum TaxID=3025782 RepID=UPI001F47103B|nr:acetylserotonin O-methyltransferase [Allorhizobium ampelinum]MCF1449855.1 hydroxyneurosporene methyltransferase [Allorhizobium ampelinum]